MVQNSIGELPKHNHNVRLSGAALEQGTTYSRISSTGDLDTNGNLTENVGSNLKHNNLAPYVTVYIWRRII